MCVKNFIVIEDSDPSKFKSFNVEGVDYSINEKINDID